MCYSSCLTTAITITHHITRVLIIIMFSIKLPMAILTVAMKLNAI